MSGFHEITNKELTLSAQKKKETTEVLTIDNIEG
jgi:hypothetical protein